MLEQIIKFSLKNKLIVILFTTSIVLFGLYSLTQLSIGAVPDVTNNQIQVISTSKNLSTQDVEKFITYPVELEMANLPGVKEIRSVSKFGLSVVTVVFDDKMGTYLPRQLLAEKLKTAADNIPQGYANPEMGPITTGLGEVYQYTLEVEEPYKNKYSISDLRTIQDWIVKRQLSGIPGVVEINTWGGFLKQYEVAIDIDKLKQLDISINDVYASLENNNGIAGGGYIEKNNEAYFVRGESLLKTIEDIENITIMVRGNTPVLIKDIATVGMGSATRFGAITGNGQGEKVLGQIMMIKDGNSKQTIESIHKRIKEVEKILPKGVYINGFLDRSDLIGKTTFTVEENLILGSLIVIFIVVLLLGNFRSGLVIASVIPLSLLFTLSMMYVFKIDANLMSLGAIDFGIIIDGAVIIVEFIAFKISQNYSQIQQLAVNERKDEIDRITLKSTNKMLHSAIFGQMIILIVFIPILSLQGVEGKMFKPMAMTFSFALIGAMLLSFTYIPVISSLVIKPTKVNTKNISSKIMAFLNKLYEPTIKWALDYKKTVLAIAFAFFIFSILLFTKMGGEFVPTLDEGDFVIQPVLKTGTSLTKTIEITTQIEKILIEKFPEVDQVVSRIGAAEVPTDPMSMEESDVIIKLKPKNQWVSAQSKDELADKFKEALLVIPGIDIEFTQPIEMRFNELITGVRSDVAIKIYGEDLDILFAKANEIKNLVDHIEGASDVSVEKIDKLPQMSVNYRTEKIAQYGLNTSDINKIISSGFAGATFGTIFEGEKQFDLVMRFNQEQRDEISDLTQLWIDTPLAGKVPLSELAEIKYTTGPAKISRDNTQRRIVIGINVRNRDMQSVVNDVKKIVEQKVILPEGYKVVYGGQFENLNSAKKRLSIALPIALLLIFILLHFAFKSVKEALMVYSAIPLAAVGGIIFLWIRGLPFSISAGVGFIALFGIAVLNGIVLIEHFKELKKEGVSDIYERIIRGTKERLRPVLLTALAAALGFLPMAISKNAGAEVQRPLATVVIGGLITSTFLTMIVLPVLYAIFDNHKIKMKFKNKKMTLIIFFFSIFGSMNAQENIELKNLIDKAIVKNKEVKIEESKLVSAKFRSQSSVQFTNTNVYLNNNQNNFSQEGYKLNEVGIEQSFDFPTKLLYQRKLVEKEYDAQFIELEMLKNNLAKKISILYYELVYLKNKEKIFISLDSLYGQFAHNENIKNKFGETNHLQKLLADAKLQQIKTNQALIASEIQSNYQTFYNLIPDTVFSINQLELIPLNLFSNNYENSLSKKLNSEREQLSMLYWKKSKQEFLPDFNISYFQSMSPELSKPLKGFQVGVELPLLFFGKNKLVQSQKILYESQLLESEKSLDDFETINNQLIGNLKFLDMNMSVASKNKFELAPQLIKFAQLNYEKGEIDFFDYLQTMDQVKEIELNYLNAVLEYNLIQLELYYHQ
ncbi:MAG: CusA/CzcA family heavy metal efflux RND transporter [Flavobacteriaceae bacterium]|nr:CusA/CzcA family heavy metal efflux RND transporter [Flavobacteriaceae bacterium]